MRQKLTGLRNLSDQDEQYRHIYGKQIGLRWRWYSMSLDKYFEYVVTSKGFVLTPL